ncbi:MAG: DeoR/GlpR family DNA-binding transcription regulator [Trueperaceae bacterium]
MESEPKLLAEERRQNILGLIQENGSARTVELARLFKVSDQTIRRDLEGLQEKGLISKHHGGGVLLSYQALSYRERTRLRHAEKLRIAVKAAQLVRDGMTVALGPGTTTEQVARQLDGRSIEVVTNSIAVAAAITDPATRVRLTGGSYRPTGELVVGEWSVGNLADLFVDVAFIGVSGVGSDIGYTVTARDEALVLRQLVRVAKRAVVVTDSSKFHRVAEEALAPLSAVHTVITDSGIPDGDRMALQKWGVDVWIVDNEVRHQP